MIFITGDTHCPIDISKLNTDRFPAQKELHKSDFVIICGDFGAVWDGSKSDAYWQSWLNDKPFTTLFIDGNHENFDLLNQYPVVDYCGGKAHQIMPSIYHLMRGEIFTIDGLKFFTMGGAASHDKAYRKEGKSWWKEEMPSDAEYQNALHNLDAHDWSVDFVLSHCAPDSIQNQIADWYEHDRLTNFLESIKEDLLFTRWMFGHYHIDKEFPVGFSALYDQVRRIK